MIALPVRGSEAAAPGIYHLSPTGSDATGDGSLAAPYLSFAGFCADHPAPAGDTLRLLGGVYDDPPKLLCGGAPGSPLVVEAAPGEHAVVHVGGAVGIQVKAPHVTVQGLEVVGDNQSITYAEALAGWWTAPDHLNGNGVIIDAADVTVRDLLVHDVPGAGISTTKSAAGAVIEDNVVYNTAWWSTKGTHGIVVKDIDALAGYDTIVVRRNVVVRSESRLISHVFAKGTVQMEIDEGGAMIAQVNAGTFTGRYDISDNLFAFNGKGAGLKSPHIDFAHNTLYGSGTTIGATGVAARGQGATDLTLSNNALQAGPGLNAVEMDPATQITTCSGNLIEGGFKNGAECADGIGGNIVASDIFSDPVSGDFTLASGRTGAGVPPAELAAMSAELQALGVPLRPAGWCEDLAPMIEGIIANRPQPSTVDRSDPTAIVVSFPDTTNPTGRTSITLAIDDSATRPERVKLCGVQPNRYYRGTLTGLRVTGFEAGANPLTSGIASATLLVDGAVAGVSTTAPFGFDLETPPGQGTIWLSGSMTNLAGQDAQTVPVPIHYDNLAPALSITGTPVRPTWQWGPRAVAFTASDPRGVTVRCALDEAPLSACPTPTSFVTTTRAPGLHTFHVEAVDGLGNRATASASFRILPHLQARAGLTTARRGTSTLVRRLWVRVPKGARATVRCPGCGPRPSSVNGRLFRAGSKLQVRVTRTGATGWVRTYAFRRSGPPLVTSACLPPGGSSPRPCSGG